MAVDWNPTQYRKFADQRAQPFWDLVDLVQPGRIDKAVDLGCGSGELTTELGERFDIADLTGLDSSSAMLAEASHHETDRVRFLFGDIATWTSDADHDLVLANASLQWVPDHPAVLGCWVKALRPGGQLAVQVPANADHDSHLASVTVAHREPFLSAFGDDGVPPDPVAANVLAPADYAERLFDLGIAEPHVRLQVYPHVMDSTHDVVEWVRGTSLTRFFKRLPDKMHGPFVEAYRVELISRLGERRPFFYPFKRILMWGRTESA